jgi:hypothetical protein
MIDWFTWIVVTILWWMFDYSVVMISFIFLEIWIQEDLVFEFFLLRLLEDLMSIADLYTFLTKVFLLLTFTPTYWLKLIQDLNCLCMLVQISELERYYHWVFSIWPLKTQLHSHKLMGTGLTFYEIWRWLLVLTQTTESHHTSLQSQPNHNHTSLQSCLSSQPTSHATWGWIAPPLMYLPNHYSQWWKPLEGTTQLLSSSPFISITSYPSKPIVLPSTSSLIQERGGQLTTTS